ncbi:hypothetical protein ACT91Q_16050 [Brevibacillus thermoruber]|uniref:hypothetical protein n=1 Tax=Brevibacillus thermoruber TaxID=33942 RepID=UPI00404135FE
MQRKNREYNRIVRRKHLALAFDIAVQNGGIKNLAAKEIERQIRGKKLSDIEKMRIIAKEVADASNPRWCDDVLSRKMTIVIGGGTVHGKKYDLAKQYGLSDRKIKR